MNEPCVVKSLKHGITLILNPDIPFNELIFFIKNKFSNMAKFFGNSKLILRIEGRALSNEELIAIIKAIEDNTEIDILYIDEGDNLRDKRMVGLTDRFYFEKIDQNAKIITENLKSGDTVTSETSLIILGDIKKNSSAVARGNIIVYGSIEGECYAGYDKNPNAYIVSMDIDSDEINIGGTLGKASYERKKKIFSHSDFLEPLITYIYDNEIHTEPLKNGALKERIIH